MKKRGEVVLWAELCPHKIHVESQIPNVTAFEYRAFKEAIRVKEISSVQLSCSVMFDSETPWTAAHQASLSITNSRRLLKLISIE